MPVKAPFRAEHLGSLKRPDELLKARAAYDKGELPKAELKKQEDVAIRDIVKLQQEVGIQSITDGEFTRHMFYDGFHDNLEGNTFYPALSLEDGFCPWLPTVMGMLAMGQKTAPAWICTSKLKRSKPSQYRAQFETLKALVPPEAVPGIKITVTSPFWQHLRHGKKSYTGVYANDDEYFADIIRFYREELHELYDAGCRNIQIDDPWLACWVDQNMLDKMARDGIDAQAILDYYVNTYKSVLRDLPKDLVKGMHLCRGNFKDGKHWSAGGYDAIAEQLFNSLDIDVFYLEYDSERAGSFEPIRHLPRNKHLVLGLVSTKTAEMENVDELVKRVHQAADMLVNGIEKRSKEEALNQLSISPQCGFASHSEGNPVTREVMKAKLALVSEVAQRVWS